jgi:hypothetical protein
MIPVLSGLAMIVCALKIPGDDLETGALLCFIMGADLFWPLKKQRLQN